MQHWMKLLYLAVFVVMNSPRDLSAIRVSICTDSHRPVYRSNKKRQTYNGAHDIACLLETHLTDSIPCQKLMASLYA